MDMEPAPTSTHHQHQRSHRKDGATKDRQPGSGRPRLDNGHPAIHKQLFERDHVGSVPRQALRGPDAAGQTWRHPRVDRLSVLPPADPDATRDEEELGEENVSRPALRERAVIALTSFALPYSLATGFWVVVCVCWAWTPWAGHWFEEKSYFCSGCSSKVASQRQGAAHILYGPDGALPPKPRFIAGQGDPA